MVLNRKEFNLHKGKWINLLNRYCTLIYVKIITLNDFILGDQISRIFLDLERYIKIYMIVYTI